MQKSALGLLGFCGFVDCAILVFVVWVFVWWVCGCWESICDSIFGKLESKKSILYTRANGILSAFFDKKV